MTKKQIEKFATNNNLTVDEAEVYLKKNYPELKGEEELPEYDDSKWGAIGNPFIRPSTPHQQFVKKFATFIGNEGGRK